MIFPDYLVRARNPTREGLCSPLQVFWPVLETGRMLLLFPAGMTEKPTIIMAAVGLAQAKTEVFVKIVASNRLPGQRAPLCCAARGNRFRAGAKKNPSC